jgi:hypothetical protein
MRSHASGIRLSKIDKPTRAMRASIRALGDVLEQLRELAALVHRHHDVRAPDEFSLDVQLRDRRPRRVRLDTISQFLAREHVSRRVLHAVMIEDAARHVREPALRRARRPLHVNQHRVRLHVAFDRAFDVLVRGIGNLGFEIIVRVGRERASRARGGANARGEGWGRRRATREERRRVRARRAGVGGGAGGYTAREGAEGGSSSARVHDRDAERRRGAK